LGSAQAGLIVGRSEIVSRLRKHSLYRALRADKLCLSALEATLDAHVRGVATSEVPALRMLAHTKEEIAARAKEFLNKLSLLKPVGLDVTVVTGESAIGGGCGPNTLLPTLLIGITHSTLSPDEIENRLRRHEIPVVARISGDKVLIDLRTVETEDEAELLKAVESLQTT
jgi:L-seryl-tRNA(Ser) seleniumtransferase